MLQTDDTLKVLKEGTRLMARWDLAGGGFMNVGEIVFDPVEHHWLGLRGEGTTLYFETSPDGQTFTAFASLEAPFPLTDVRLSVGGGNWAAIALPTVVSFDQVQACSTPPP
jgi:hypothetical protein